MIFDRGDATTPKYLRGIIGKVDPKTGKAKTVSKSEDLDNNGEEDTCDFKKIEATFILI